jgi:hypothetical protein
MSTGRLQQQQQEVSARASSAHTRAQEASAPARAKGRAAYDAGRTQHEARGKQEALSGDKGVYADFSTAEEPPTLRHDHGHLDDGSGNLDTSKMRDPTWSDHFARARWVASGALAT